ncbi:MAG: PadR family transcriptional regulator [Tissierellia bacterium]|nr:PadR family transcriptional regulator [Bacillota bacterium]NLK57897.1 PadR family transcriptional regulator [Tissierellia bacterium]
MNAQLKKGVIELCALSLLLKGDRYGYELVEEISKNISISEGTIYPLLRRFRNEGYVDTYLEESQSGPPRKYYKLTASGQAALVKQEEEWHAFVRGVNTILEGATHEEN